MNKLSRFRFFSHMLQSIKFQIKIYSINEEKHTASVCLCVYVFVRERQWEREKVTVCIRRLIYFIYIKAKSANITGTKNGRISPEHYGMIENHEFQISVSLLLIKSLSTIINKSLWQRRYGFIHVRDFNLSFPFWLSHSLFSLLLAFFLSLVLFLSIAYPISIFLFLSNTHTYTH